MAIIQAYSPDELYLVAEVQNCPRRMEKELHDHFREHHLHGEWFSSEVLDFFEKYLKKRTLQDFLNEHCTLELLSLA